jgi:flagellar biosynthetic protein FliQ
MNEGDVASVLRETLLVTLKLGGPVLAIALLVGMVMSVIQAVTQINEQTLAFVPKVAAICGTMILAGPFMLAALTDYMRMMFDRLVAVGGN